MREHPHNHELVGMLGAALKVYIGYGIGDFGLNIYWNALSLILVFWYAEVVGLPPDQAGLIYFIGTMWDAVSDVAVANWAQRTRTRFGTYRPYLLGGGAMLGASFILLFWIPPLQGLSLFLFMVAAHMLFRLTYTLVAVPYSALASRLSYDSGERTILSGTRMGFAFLGLLAISGSWFPIVRYFGDGTDTAPGGFLMGAIVGGGIATAALTLCFFATRERELGTPPESDFSIAGFLRAVTSNAALGVLLGAIFLQSAAGATFQITLAFYIESHSAVFAAKETVMTIYAIAILVSVPVWTIAVRRFGKKRAWIAACWIVIAGGIWLAVTAPVLVAGVPVQILLYGIGFGGFGVLVWALVPDTVEYGQWRTGSRNEGAVFGSVLLVQKSAGGLMGLGVGMVLTWIGYDSGLDFQATETANRLELYIFAAPAVLLFLSSLVLSQLPLNRTLHAEIVDRIRNS